MRGEPAPGASFQGSRREYGRHIARLVTAWPSGEREDLLGAFQRIESMANPLGLDCMLQASPDRPSLLLIFARLKSARLRALFCYVKQHAVFVEGEHRKSFSALRFSAHYVDRFQTAARHDVDALHCPPSMQEAVQDLLRTELGIEERCRLHPSIIQPAYPPAAPLEYQLAIAVKGPSQMFACWGEAETEMVSLHLEKPEVLNFAPARGLIAVTGKIFKRPHRQQLADLFNRMMLQELASPILITEKFALQRFLSPHPLTPPPGLGLTLAGPTAIRLRSEHAANYADYAITFGETVIRSLTRDYDLRHALAICGGAAVLCIDLCLQQAPSPQFPKGRRIKARITPQRLAIESKLDEDLYLIELCLMHWGVTTPRHPAIERGHA